MIRITIALAAAALATTAQAAPALVAASIAEQQAAMVAGQTSSARLVGELQARIRTLDRAGPRLNAVLAFNPRAVAMAEALDRDRRAGHVRGPLHGVAALIKDNIDIAGLPTTAGSLALADNIPERDAPIIARLRAAGVVILGKTNLSEWANFRSIRSISGWSAMGGLVRNPHVLDRSACGSSSGSGAAVAAGFAAFALGTETDGSIICPAAMTGIVGLKPTLGLVSRSGVVPLSPAQDTAGPMTRTVADAAAVLTVIAGSDPADPATSEADARRTDYVASLDRGALKGVRLGVWHSWKDRSPGTDAAFAAALETLRREGAILVELTGPDVELIDRIRDMELDCLRAEFKIALNAYLAGAPPAVTTRSLAELIDFDRVHASREMPLFGQELFEQAQAKPGVLNTYDAHKRAEVRTLARTALDRMLVDAQVAAVVAPSNGPTPIVDPVNGDSWFESPATLPAVSGYPHLTVPMGAVSGLPLGLSFLGPAWSDARLLALGYAYEQASQARPSPAYLPSIAERPEVARAYRPAGDIGAPRPKRDRSLKPERSEYDPRSR